MNPNDETNLPQVALPAITTIPGSMPTNSTSVSDNSDELLTPSAGPAITSDMASLQAKVGALPSEANDLDIIEKEWVTQLKNVVGHTAQDPHNQQTEITKIKADYMKKRYNKDIKVTGT